METASLISFESGISPGRAEEAIATLDAEFAAGHKVLLQFEGYPYVNAGAGWRIGNALRLFGGTPLLEVQVPPFRPGTDWFRTFDRSGLGAAIAAHASAVISEGADVTDDFRRYYRRQSVRVEQNSVFLGDLHEGINVDPDRVDLFRDTFLHCLRYVNVSPQAFEEQSLRSLIRLTFEAVQNVYDHAGRRPLHEVTRIVSYLSLGYYKSLAGHADLTGHLPAYLGRLHGSVPGVSSPRFIEVCVNDDGVGIAARQSQDVAVYQGPRELEVAAVMSALEGMSTIKLRTNDSQVRGTPGQGFTYIAAGLKRLRAFGVLRTGRLLAVFDGADADCVAFSLTPSLLGYMPGTALDLLIPIPQAKDTQPELFAGV